jgi:hypothetical protein
MLQDAAPPSTQRDAAPPARGRAVQCAHAPAAASPRRPATARRGCGWGPAGAERQAPFPSPLFLPPNRAHD